MSKWQPIETAPKDKKIIGGYWNELGKWRSIMARYYSPGTLEAGESCNEIDEDRYAPEGWYEESETQDEIFRCETPTHWQPCPAEPHEKIDGPEKQEVDRWVCDGCIFAEWADRKSWWQDGDGKCGYQALPPVFHVSGRANLYRFIIKGQKLDQPCRFKELE
jgi:hypothetical protein